MTEAERQAFLQYSTNGSNMKKYLVKLPCLKISITIFFFFLKIHLKGMRASSVYVPCACLGLEEVKRMHRTP